MRVTGNPLLLIKLKIGMYLILGSTVTCHYGFLGRSDQDFLSQNVHFFYAQKNKFKNFPWTLF